MQEEKHKLGGMTIVQEKNWNARNYHNDHHIDFISIFVQLKYWKIVLRRKCL